MVLRIALAIFTSNILSMSIINFFELSSQALPGIYLACFALLLLTTRKLNFPSLNRGWLMTSLVLALILFLPRLPYLLEPFFRVSMNAVCFDDWWHFQELSSLVNTTKYPAISTFNKSSYLGFYYAPWMLAAAMSFGRGVTTLRQSIGATHLIYLVIIASFICTAACVLFRQRLERLVFFSLCVFYGGFDFGFWLLKSLAHRNFTPENVEWWPQALGLRLQYSNFFTLNLWVIHHTLSAVIFLLACWLLASQPQKPAKAILPGLLFASSLFSSVFVFIGGLPLLLALVIQQSIRLRSLLVTIFYTSLVSAPLLWIYLAKTTGDSKDGFRFLTTSNSPLPIAFFFFLVVVCLELGPLLWLAGKRVKSNQMLPLYFGSSAYLLSTFAISLSGYNNYAMRGSILPIFTLIFLATPTLCSWLRKALSGPKEMSKQNLVLCVALLLLLPYLGGGLLEYTTFFTNATANIRQSLNGESNKLAYFYNLNRQAFDGDSAVISKDSSFTWYLFDQHIANKANLNHSDSEIIISDNSFRFSLPRLLRLRPSGSP